jgi:hypothetical protein
MKIRCRTLFDITQTHVSNRRGLLESNVNPAFDQQRLQQANFETVLQVISLRSQPENISETTVTQTKLRAGSEWGTAYRSKNKVKCWQFEFTVAHTKVFAREDHELGALLADCQNVPMIKDLDEWHSIANTLDVSPELRNIIFEVVDATN